MKWNRELNPAVVGMVCLIASFLVLDQSFRLVFRPLGKVSLEVVVLTENVLAELPSENLHERLAAVKERTWEIEIELATLKGGIPTSSGMSRVEGLVQVGQLEKTLKILSDEEQKVIADMADELPQKLSF